MKKIVFTLILLTLGLSMTYSQEFSKNSIFVGLSPIGRWENSTREGSGINWTIGYQKNIWKNKIRFVPSLSFGNYSSKGIDDATELNANSTTLKTSLNFDILKIKSFSVFIGSGLAVNYSSGSFNFFVRGVDRFYSNFIENVAYGLDGFDNAFEGADELWESFQEKLNSFVNNPINGGASTIVTPTKNRPDWDKVQQVLNGELPISELGCN